MNLTSGPATKSCQKKAIGKFLTTSSQNVANICELKPPLKRMVAIKLIIGHINQIEKTEIARIIAIGLSFPGVTILKAHFLASGPAMNVSRIKPATIMIGNSPNAAARCASRLLCYFNIIKAVKGCKVVCRSFCSSDEFCLSIAFEQYLC